MSICVVQLKKCKYCGQLSFDYAALTVSMVGGEYYTDGCFFGPGYVSSSGYRTCRGCNGLIDPCDAGIVDEGRHFDDLMKKYGKLPELKALNKGEILRHLSVEKNLSKMTEITLRTDLWWMFNHRYRGDCAIDFSADREFDENLASLITVLKSSSEDVILLAEAFREFGKFDEALKQLDAVNADNKDCVRRGAIYELSERKVRKVMPVKLALPR